MLRKAARFKRQDSKLLFFLPERERQNLRLIWQYSATADTKQTNFVRVWFYVCLWVKVYLISLQRDIQRCLHKSVGLKAKHTANNQRIYRFSASIPSLETQLWLNKTIEHTRFFRLLAFGTLINIPTERRHLFIINTSHQTLICTADPISC